MKGREFLNWLSDSAFTPLLVGWLVSSLAQDLQLRQGEFGDCPFLLSTQNAAMDTGTILIRASWI